MDEKVLQRRLEKERLRALGYTTYAPPDYGFTGKGMSVGKALAGQEQSDERYYNRGSIPTFVSRSLRWRK